MRSYKRSIVAMTVLIALFLVGCAASQMKQLLVTRQSFNDALAYYKADLDMQDPITQEKWHDKYDSLIMAAQAALDGWQKFVLGETTSSTDYAEFMAIKNKLIMAGWKYFKED